MKKVCPTSTIFTSNNLSDTGSVKVSGVKGGASNGTLLIFVYTDFRPVSLWRNIQKAAVDDCSPFVVICMWHPG